MDNRVDFLSAGYSLRLIACNTHYPQPLAIPEGSFPQTFCSASVQACPGLIQFTVIPWTPNLLVATVRELYNPTTGSFRGHIVSSKGMPRSNIKHHRRGKIGGFPFPPGLQRPPLAEQQSQIPLTFTLVILPQPPSGYLPAKVLFYLLVYGNIIPPPICQIRPNRSVAFRASFSASCWGSHISLCGKRLLASRFL